MTNDPVPSEAKVEINDPVLAAGREAHDKKDFQQALGAYNDYLNRNPSCPVGLFLIATVFMEMRNFAMSSNLFERALQCQNLYLQHGKLKHPFPEIYNNLAFCLKELNNYDAAQLAFLKAVQLRPTSADFCNNVATCGINQGQPKLAERWSKRAIASEPGNVPARWNLALAYLEQGNYELGGILYDWGLRWKGGRPNKQYNCPFWTGEETETLVIHGEQGIGDEIMFASIVPDLICSGLIKKKLIFDCHPRLVRIFKRSFEQLADKQGIEFVLYETRKSREWPIDDWVWEDPPTAKCCIGSLMRYFRKSVDDFPGEPFLLPDPELVKEAKTFGVKPGAPRIGVQWRGGTMKTNILDRSMDIIHWRSFFGFPVDWISLSHHDTTPQELANLEDQTGVHVEHRHDWTQDYDKLIALCATCDLIITVNQSTVHQAGALGIPTWCMTPVKKAWRYYSPDGHKMPWYGSVELIHQPKAGDWQPVIDNIRVRLEEMFAQQEGKPANGTDDADTEDQGDADSAGHQHVDQPEIQKAQSRAS